MDGRILAAIVAGCFALSATILGLVLKPFWEGWIEDRKKKRMERRSAPTASPSTPVPQTQPERQSPPPPPPPPLVPAQQPPVLPTADHYRPIPGDPRGCPVEFECNGKRGYILPARGLSIEWGNKTNHWNWMSLDDSRFEEVAVLRDVWWLDIRGKIEHEKLSPHTTYAVNLIFRLITGNSEGLGYPFQDATVEILERRNRTICLQYPPPKDRIEEVDEVPREWDNDARWMHVMLGEFLSGDGRQGDVQVCLMARDKTKYRKAGLIVEGIEFRPKENH